GRPQGHRSHEPAGRGPIRSHNVAHMSRKILSQRAPARRRAPSDNGTDSPQQFGRFEVREHLASTGMSSVYLSDDIKSDRRVAIKTAQPNDLVSAERLHTEISLLRELKHPGIMRVLTHGIDDRVPWYAMPYLPGAAFPTLALDGEDATSS